MKIKINMYPHPVLSQKAELFDPHKCSFAELNRMRWFLKTGCKQARGVGLASNQVYQKKPKRVFYMESDDFSGIVINPQIISTESTIPSVADVEGCLSAPNKWFEVVRNYEIEVQFTSIDIENSVLLEKHLNLYGLSARIFQHEFDHLDGRCIMDHGKEVFI